MQPTRAPGPRAKIPGRTDAVQGEHGENRHQGWGQKRKGDRTELPPEQGSREVAEKGQRERCWGEGCREASGCLAVSEIEVAQDADWQMYGAGEGRGEKQHRSPQMQLTSSCGGETNNK